MTTPDTGGGMRQPEHKCPAGCNVKYCSHSEKLFVFPINTYLSYNQGILLLGICPREIKTCVHSQTCITMSVTAVFISTKNKNKTLNLTTHVSKGRRADKQILVYSYSIILLSNERNKLLIYSILWMNIKKFC